MPYVPWPATRESQAGCGGEPLAGHSGRTARSGARGRPAAAADRPRRRPRRHRRARPAAPAVAAAAVSGRQARARRAGARRRADSLARARAEPALLQLCDELARGGAGEAAEHIKAVDRRDADGRGLAADRLASAAIRRPSAPAPTHRGLSPDLVWLVAELAVSPFVHALQQRAAVASGRRAGARRGARRVEPRLLPGVRLVAGARRGRTSATGCCAARSARWPGS